MSTMDAATHESTVILTEHCAYRVLSKEQYAEEKRPQQQQKPSGSADAKPLVCYNCGKEDHFAREMPCGEDGETTGVTEVQLTPRRSGVQAQRSLFPEEISLAASSLEAIATATAHGNTATGTWTIVVGKGASSSGKGQSRPVAFDIAAR